MYEQFFQNSFFLLNEKSVLLLCILWLIMNNFVQNVKLIYTCLNTFVDLDIVS